MTDLVGYARVSTDKQDAQVQRDALAAAGVPADRLYVDSGPTGSNRACTALAAALAACHDGSTLLVTKFDRLARSISVARDIADELTRKGARLRIGGTVNDPIDPIGRLLFNVLAMIAEFEGDLIRARTREGMKVAKEKGRLRRKKPKLSPRIEGHLVAEYRSCNHSIAKLAQQYCVARWTVYRAVQRAAVADARIADATLMMPRDA
ncbi:MULTISPECIES: recombinase family protein [unclassified Rathayibacter]|uniref:recombinase family protein n=1 Tax=unclassified Rathayibacter TaxID=2609250 RepID=UPI000CE77C6A|nr:MULTISPECIES: recombinase family protein [unclassified Rathayibacter]PPF15253.1 hypothetical protein C5B92_13765 [Rathayibacter sp. AY1A4]PPG79948.1 hypothetical protein C5C52_11615 [Rathayibacter sp. AY1E5]PPH31696.1 hypothetical protein C5C94_08205 [Rathayibacter sp. AY1C3]PPH65501.1 hypothetical protein C5D25_04340 [Rathayibacter sp. AY1D7]PPI29394.1 hypothetical protein C5D66_11610 [Rathayibacter sp. AY1B4]